MPQQNTLSFLDYPATKTLKELAAKPFDLTKQGNLTPERLQSYASEACGYRLLYGTERVDALAMKALWALAGESGALDKMRQMQSGENINSLIGFPSENRAALHTATRDFFDSPQSAPVAKECAQLARVEVEKLKAFLSSEGVKRGFTDLILIGIGGSDLGPRAHYLALRHLQMPGRRVHFIANLDPDDSAHVLSEVDLAHTLVVVVSKTGTTLETATNEAIVRTQLKKAGLDPKAHMISVSMKGSPLDNADKYLECFYIWDWVGGRFSTTSMVGGVVLAFAFGFEVYFDFLRGANAMDKVALNTKQEENLPLLAALLGIWNRNFLGYPTLAVIPYSESLARFPAHLQQLTMESQGKRIDRTGREVKFATGPIVWGEPGTCSQHSFFQLLHQGTDIVPMEFIGFEKSQWGRDLMIEGTTSQQKLLANLFAQMLALATGKKDDNPNKVFPGNRPSHLLLGKMLTPYSLGALLAFYEHKIAFQGFIWNINPFDQEGVQLGKVLATRILRRFATGNYPNQPSEDYPLADVLLDLLGKE